MKLKNNKKVRVVEGHIFYELGGDWYVSGYNYPLNDEEYWDGEESLHNDETSVEEVLTFWNREKGVGDIVYGFDSVVDQWLCGCDSINILGFHSVSFSNEIGMLDGGFHSEEPSKQPRFRNQLDAIKSIATIQLKEVA